MLSIQGTFSGGVATPDETVAGREGERVVITFVKSPDASDDKSADPSGWEDMNALLAECQVATGITDLAQQHDHYLYGKPKDAE